MLADLLRELLPRHAQGLGRDVSSVGVPLVDQPPLELARDHRRPRLSELATGRVAVAVRPPVDVGQQRPLGQRLEAVDSLERVAAEQQLERRPEDLAQLQVDAAHGAVEVDLVIEVKARVEEHVERLGAVRMQSQAPLRDERVVDDPLHVDRTRGDATYIGIARDVIHVAGGEGADQRRAQGRQPFRRLEAVELARRDQVGDPARVDPLPTLEVGGGRRPKLRDLVRQGAGDEGSADVLVVEVPGVEVVLVEEVAERTVADVVQQTRHPHRLLDQLR